MKKKIYYLLFILLSWSVGENLYAQTPTGNWTDFKSPGLDTNGGRGSTENNPILISSAADLAKLASLVRDEGSTFSGKYFRLEKDLDLKEHYWKSIGMQNTNSSFSKAFEGHFDGNSKVIRNMVMVSSPSESKGLFGYITGSASIKNLFMEGISVEGNSSTGGVVGVAVNSSIINCSVSGTIRDVQDFAGGIVASAENCEISKCYSNVNFEKVKSTVGGLAGLLDISSTLSTCYSAGRVEGLKEVGGLVGKLGSDATVTYCYSMATVVDNRDAANSGGMPAGGIVGTMASDSKLSNCFARNPWIMGVATTGSTVNRIVGISSATSFPGLLNNVALASMLVNKDPLVGFVKVQDDATNPENTPNGKGVPDDYIWDGGGGWDPGDGVPPYLPQQSAPVTRVTNSTKMVTVKHKPVYSEMQKVVLLNNKYVELVDGTQINNLGGNSQEDTRLWSFTPKKSYPFNVGDTLYAVAYENGKMPSYPVRIIIVPFDNGNGSLEAPYEIYREGQLDSVRCFPDANYKLMADLDLSKYPNKFEPIGTKDNPFTGSLDGNGHIIDNLAIDGPGDNQGLFGELEGPVKSLGLENVYITGGDYVGALAGNCDADIENVYTTGTIKSTGDNVGGLVGQSSGKVLRCYSTCLVKGASNVGGLIGTALKDVESCYAAGPVFGDENIGGFIGESRTSVMLSYSWGLVTTYDNNSDYSGGFIGLATAGSSLTGCYYNPVTSGQTKGVGNDSPGCIAYDSPDRFTQVLKTADWATTAASGYYPQLNVFANNTNFNMKYCSALSVVPAKFASNETAKAIATSFIAPLKYAIDGIEREYCVIVPSGNSTTCSVGEAGKVISTLQTGAVDTLKIKVEKFNLPGSNPTVVIRERSRHICFVPNQLVPDCTPVRTAGMPNANGWANETVIYTLSSSAADGIGGPVKFQHSIVPASLTGVYNWKDLNENRDVFEGDTSDIKVQYRALNGAGLGDDQKSSQPYPIDIDKTRPVIVNASANGTQESPAQKFAIVTVKFKDPAVNAMVNPSGIARIKWEIPGVKKDSIFDFSQIVADSEGYLTKDITLPQIVGHYPVTIAITDKAGNGINNKDAGFPLDVYVIDDDINLGNYVLDSVVVDGDKAGLEDPNNPYVYRTDVCVEGETAHVILTPAESFNIAPVDTVVTGLKYGTNPVEITVVSKDKTVAQTFTVKICREPLVAGFLSLSVNGQIINIKPNKYQYEVDAVGKDVESVPVVYTLIDGESCDAPASPYDFKVIPGENTITITVTSADKKTNHTYHISVYRSQDFTVIDNIKYNDGNLEKDPDSSKQIPWKDKDGNIVYDLVSKCDAQDHYLQVIPSPASTVVTFNGDPKPDNIYRFEYANYYTVNVVVVADTPRKYIFNVVKRFSSGIFYNRWKTANDVIAVINNPDNNGGYSFSKYGWYLNGAANAETGSYLEVKKGDKVEAILSGEYNSSAGKVSITGVPTCPCIVGATTQTSILAYPSLLKSGERVTISTENISEEDLKEGNVSIVSSLGNVVNKVSLTGSNTEVTMPNAPGIYMLKVSTKSITKDFKVILN